MRVFLLLVVLASGCATQSNKPVVLWLPEPYEISRLQDVERQMAICRADAIKQTPATTEINQTNNTGTANSPMMDLMISSEIQRSKNQKLLIVFEGCMYENNFRKVTLTRQEYSSITNPENDHSLNQEATTSGAALNNHTPSRRGRPK